MVTLIAECCLQVTALALCKLNKNDVFLRRLGTATRHQHPEHLFWDADEVPEECLEVGDASVIVLSFSLSFLWA